jgi:hypothetical protein
MAGFQKQRPIARRHAAERMTGRIGLEVCLGFDDAPAQHAAANPAHDHLAEQIPGQFDRVARGRRASERREPAGPHGRCRGIDSTGAGVGQW